MEQHSQSVDASASADFFVLRAIHTKSRPGGAIQKMKK
jgi:hypothetical protein